jgi:plastocyanin
MIPLPLQGVDLRASDQTDFSPGRRGRVQQSNSCRRAPHLARNTREFASRFAEVPLHVTRHVDNPGMRKLIVLLLGLALSIAFVQPAWSSADHPVTLTGFTFRPDQLDVVTGDTVIWSNIDFVAHNVSGGSFASGNFASGTFSHTFDTAGTFPYLCTLHSGMAGTIRVTDAPTPIVPEPPAIVLAGVAALAGLLWWRARRRAERATLLRA